MKDLLIELGCEDLPAGSMQSLAEQLAAGVADALRAAGLTSAQAAVFATPRRLGLRIADVASAQPEQQVKRKGPSVAAAFDEAGQPTKALEGFLRSAGATPENLSRIETPKGEWLMLEQTRPGKSLAAVLEAALPDIFRHLSMPRRMRWSDETHEFLRPVLWLLALHGSEVLPLSAFGHAAGNETRGHRSHSPGPHTIGTPADYESVLRAAYVEPDMRVREQRIVDGVEAEAKRMGGTALLDPALVEEVNALVEWPVALGGRFEEAYLAIPKEALIKTMQENQRYFAVLDAEGEILPAFVTVANLESSNPATVIQGNERVIRPRFADTMFFWQQDARKRLADHTPALADMLFQEKLGSVADKCTRMQDLAAWLADEIGADSAEVAQAVSLCKCDLNTEIVKELASMQGICGRYYAARDGLVEAVARAMEEHYYPRHAGAPLPSNDVAAVVALADRLDTLVGIFGIGLKPTGAKDPYALRRAALAIVRMLIEKDIDLSLDAMLEKAHDAYGSILTEADPAAVKAYVIERLRGYLAERGHPVDAIEAVLAAESDRPLDIEARLEAVTTFRREPAAEALAAAAKRVGNILDKATGNPGEAGVDPSLLRESAEQALHRELLALKPSVDACRREKNHAQALVAMATLRDPVDTFFDSVMVNADDPALKANRLALLAELDALFNASADIGRLQSTGSS
ncbi:MAG: glycine--tRNA ligase subunit beta [Gammaproteobacteria bacterium]|nr:MAG: glycine--tRNA ligase subunit beta [Gammaproteobacteria bacterium]PIE37790.1 MAG: glycine--tRNA ligase subunit beta [Gammaproteobacteria bacterium]